MSYIDDDDGLEEGENQARFLKGGQPPKAGVVCVSPRGQFVNFQ